jgi:hypothetical protein
MSLKRAVYLAMSTGFKIVFLVTGESTLVLGRGSRV